MGKLALCIPRNQFALPFDQWSPQLIDRDICETDLNFLQVIPYVVALDEESNRVFMYMRGQAGGEDKLKSKWSIGLGGHIDELPKEGETMLDLIAREAARELEEEVGLVIDPAECELYQTAFLSGGKLDCVYLPHSDNTADHVHLGVIIVQTVNGADLNKHEEGVIEKGTWVTPEELLSIALGKDKNRVVEYWSLSATIKVLQHVIQTKFSQNLFSQTASKSNIGVLSE